MKVEIKFRGVEPTDDLRTLARRHIELALDRFVDTIRLVSVELSDPDGPRRNKRCTVTLKSRRVGTITVHQNCADFPSAIEQAFDIARRTLARQLDALAEDRRIRLFRWRFS